MKNKFYFVLSAFIVPFMMIGCNSNKNDVTDIKVELKDETRELQVGQTVNKSDFNVTVTFKDKTTKELKENEWTSDTTFPYVLNYKDRNAGHTVFNVKYNKTTKDSNVFVAPYFEFDYLTIGWNDTVAFDVPLYETVSKNEEVEVTYKIYDDSKDVITFDDDTKPSNKIKLKKAFTEAQKDAFLYVELKDGTLLDGCTIRANVEPNTSVTFDDNGVYIAGNNKITVPVIKGNKVARKIADNGAKGSQFSEINLPYSIEELGTNAFQACTKVTKANIPENVKTIKDGAFKGCSELIDLDISSNNKCLTFIGNEAFANTGLKSFTLPDSVFEIGDSCFMKANLESFTLTSNSNLTFIGSAALTQCDKLLYTDEDKETGEKYDTYVKVNVNGSTNNHYILSFVKDSADKCVVNSSCKIIDIKGDAQDKKTEISIPEGVEVINRGALTYSKISTIELPSTIKAIGKGSLTNFSDTGKTIKFANYDGWYYIDENEEVQTIEKDVLENTPAVVKLLQKYDLLRK